MKKSTKEACTLAEQNSKAFATTVYVMEKKGKKSVVCMSEWVRKERTLEGWIVVAQYRNGKRI